MVTREPLLNELVLTLSAASERLLAAPSERHVLRFSRSQVDSVRAAFAAMIRRGEAKLHRLCELLGRAFLDDAYDLQSVVIGEMPSSRQRFTWVHPLSRSVLYSQTDLDLGNRLLERFRYRDGDAADDAWVRPVLVANFVEYQPLVENERSIHKMISRIKAEEEIWNKVVDELFELDHLIARDKELRRLSRYVKDVFGVKLVVGTRRDVPPLQATLEQLRWSADELARLDVPCGDSTASLQFLETKNYLDTGRAKQSGWRAMKSVVDWWERTFELQLQPLDNYYRERDRLTQESHAAFKSRREALRDRVAQKLPLFGFYRDLLRWLFIHPQTPPPDYPRVEILLED